MVQRFQNDFTGAPYQEPVVINQLERKKDGLAVTSLVFGILGIVFCWCLVLPLLISLCGFIMGIVSLVRTRLHTGLALAGVITSAIGIMLCILFFLLLIFWL